MSQPSYTRLVLRFRVYVSDIAELHLTINVHTKMKSKPEGESGPGIPVSFQNLAHHSKPTPAQTQDRERERRFVSFYPILGQCGSHEIHHTVDTLYLSDRG